MRTFVRNLAVISLIFGWVFQAHSKEAELNTYQLLEKFGDVYSIIKSNYVTEVDESELIELAITNMVSALDQHSVYMNKENYNDFIEKGKGEFGGIGFKYALNKSKEGYIIILSVIEDTPGERAGLQEGDLITHADDKPIAEMNNEEVQLNLRGEVGTKVTITVIREGVKEPFDVEITRGIIKSDPVKYAVNGKIGYVHLFEFSKHAGEKLKSAIKSIQEEIGSEMEGFILDLRYNTGGHLDQSIEVADVFLSEGVITSTQGRQKDDLVVYNARSKDMLEGIPVVVLINEHSASASEIVAGALQDQKRAVIIGVNSYGKGSVQVILPLGDGSGIKITQAYYYTPSGALIDQNIGIRPDIYVKQEYMEKAAKDENNSLNEQEESSKKGIMSKFRVFDEHKEEFKKMSSENDLQLIYAMSFLHSLKIVNSHQMGGN